MEKYLLRSISAVLFLMISSCGPKPVVDENKPTFDENVSWGAVVQKSDGEYSGTGGFRFLRTLSSPQMSIGLELGAYLEADNSSVEYVMFATTPTLTDGVHLRLYRDTAGQLLGTLDINNTGLRQVAIPRLQNYAVSPLKMAIDLHAFGTMARVMTYDSGAATNAAYYFDSRRVGDLVNGALLSSSLAGGIHGGVILTNARVFKAIRRDPVLPREQAQ